MNRQELVDIIYDVTYDDHVSDKLADILIAKYGWQPMETAPKDGTSILIWDTDPTDDKYTGEVEKVHWDNNYVGSGRWREEWVLDRTMDSDDRWLTPWRPVAWKPLPEKP